MDCKQQLCCKYSCSSEQALAAFVGDSTAAGSARNSLSRRSARCTKVLVEDVSTLLGKLFEQLDQLRALSQGSAKTVDIVLRSGDAWQIRLGADTESCNNGVFVWASLRPSGGQRNSCISRKESDTTERVVILGDPGAAWQ